MAFDSLFIGVTGLESYQNQIDVISNNIANVSTTGYKDQNVNFQDLLYQAQSYATAPTNTQGGTDPQDVGLGVKVGSIDTDWTQGGLQTTGVNTNMAINGDGFFILQSPDGSSSPVYTRNGDFSLNANGLLYDPTTGLAVQGYMANDNGVITQTGVTSNLTIPIGLASEAVGTGSANAVKLGPTGDDVYDASLGGNLDQTDWIQQAQGVQDGTANAGTPYTISTTIYDSLGNPHEATITFTPDAAGAAAADIPTNPTIAAGGTLVTATGGSQPAAPITVTVNATGTGATLSQTIGGVTTNVAIASGGTATINGTQVTVGDYAAADQNDTATIDSIASSGLPAQVANADGQLTSVGSRWQVSVSFADGTQFQAITTPGSIAANGTVTNPTTQDASSGVIGYAYFDQNGQYINTSGIEGVALTATNQSQNISSADDVHAAGTNASSDDGNMLNIVSWGTGSTDQSTAPTASGNPATGPIALGLWNMTSLSADYSASVLAQNGYAAGTLSNITIGDTGVITGAFTNGQTKTLGQVALATFQNEDGLNRTGDSYYTASASSGLAQVGTATTGQYGSIDAGSLEESNVSLADEFTKLISAQNAYQANSKSITVADEDMQTLTNLIR